MDFRYTPNDNYYDNLSHSDVNEHTDISWKIKINEHRTRQVIQTLLFNKEVSYWSHLIENEMKKTRNSIESSVYSLSWLSSGMENKGNKSRSNGHAICVEKTLNDVMSSENSIHSFSGK